MIHNPVVSRADVAQPQGPRCMTVLPTLRSLTREHSPSERSTQLPGKPHFLPIAKVPIRKIRFIEKLAVRFQPLN
jgi:hypothetical protein